MKLTTVGEIYTFLNKIAPFDNQMKSDNCGLIVGDYDAVARKVHVCLDVTNDVVKEANDKNADLILSHHPLMYPAAVTKVLSGDPLHALVKGNINLIAAHTNLDVAVDGVAELMLKRLGLPETGTVLFPFNTDGTGFGRVSELESPITVKQLVAKCKEAFNCTVVRYVDSGKPISRVGLTSGSGSDLVEAAFEAKCDAFICGDVKHGKMVFAANYGLTLIDAGHFHTEDIFCDDMRSRLTARFPTLDVDKSAHSVDICCYS